MLPLVVAVPSSPFEREYIYRHYLFSIVGRRLLRFCLFLALILALVFYLDIDWSLLLKNADQGRRFLLRFLQPDWSFIGQLIKPLGQTLGLALMGAATGLLLSVPVALAMSKKASYHPLLSVLSSALAALLRSIPTLVWAAILVSLFSIGVLSGYVALSLIMTLQGSKLLREYIDSLAQDFFDALAALGAPKSTEHLALVIPAIKDELASTSLILFESGIRGASVLGLVGAGGIGQILQTQLAYLRYDRLSLVILLLFLLVFSCDLLSHGLRALLLRQDEGDLRERGSTNVTSTSSNLEPSENHSLSAEQKGICAQFMREKYVSNLIALGLIGILLMAVLVIFLPQFPKVLQGFSQLYALAWGLIHPDFSYSPRMLSALFEGLAMAALASCLGLIGGLILTAGAVRDSSPALQWLAKIIANVLRSFPSLILAIVFLVMVGPGSFAGVLALSFYTAGILCRYFSEKFATLSPEKQIAFAALGLSETRSYYMLVLNEFETLIWNLGLYRFESNMRNAAVLGMVGAGGIGAILESNIRYRNWDKVSLLLIALAASAILLDKLALKLRKRLD